MGELCRLYAATIANLGVFLAIHSPAKTSSFERPTQRFSYHHAAVKIEDRLERRKKASSKEMRNVLPNLLAMSKTKKAETIAAGTIMKAKNLPMSHWIPPTPITLGIANKDKARSARNEKSGKAGCPG